MAQATNYQCPACGGPLHFSGTTQKLECDYCGSSYTVEEIDKKYKQEEKQEGMSGLVEYNCPSCGAQLFCDATTAATSCPYCGNNQVIPSQFKGGKMPQKIIPFRVEKEAAIKGLKNHYKGKKLLPKVFSAQNHIEEVKGVYVPFWLFDGHARAEVDFKATRTAVHYTSKEKVATTSHYDIKRSGTVKFEKISVDASQKMDDALMDSIEPFDYDNLYDFTASYLPGFFAEVYDVSTDECFERARVRAENTALQEMSNSVGGYDSVSVIHKKIEVINDKVTYAFLPVWVLSTKWRDQNYIFAMNGQTGKMVGNLPVDKGKFWKYFFGITLGVAAVVAPLVYFFF
jgi:uncharacterized Zn finger protein (UPF0148 family)